MKLKFFFLLFFIAYYTIVAQKQYEALYDISINGTKIINKLEKNTTDPSQIFMFKKMLNGANNTELLLKFDKKKAVCEPADKLSIDDTSLKYGKGILVLITAENKIFSDTESNKFYITRGASGSYHFVTQPLDKIEWILTKEVKEYKGYTLKKAVSKINGKKGVLDVTAWFCPDVPVSFGPTLFYGLPGLIMDISIKAGGSGFDYGFSLISLKVKEEKEPIIIPLDKYEIFTEEESQAFFGSMMGKFKN